MRQYFLCFWSTEWCLVSGKWSYMEGREVGVSKSLSCCSWYLVGFLLLSGGTENLWCILMPPNFYLNINEIHSVDLNVSALSVLGIQMLRVPKYLLSKVLLGTCTRFHRKASTEMAEVLWRIIITKKFHILLAVSHTKIFHDYGQFCPNFLCYLALIIKFN